MRTLPALLFFVVVMGIFVGSIMYLAKILNEIALMEPSLINWAG